RRQMTIVTAVLALVALMPTFGVWPDASMPGLTSHMASLLFTTWWPGSFNFPGFQAASPTTLVPLMRDTIILYYSFETLTTLNYGDVIPATPPARFFSVAEALVGQLYLAVLVARFVGLHLTHYNTTRRD